MDAWMHEQGAWVQGHHALVRREGYLARAVCSCGYASTDLFSIQGGCLALVIHLAAMVRLGAPVRGRYDGPAAAGEPSYPLPPDLLPPELMPPGMDGLD